jgi:hypothetical protein
MSYTLTERVMAGVVDPQAVIDRSRQIDEIEAALVQIGNAHHKAFEATNGSDPDWAFWYSEQLALALFGGAMTLGRMIDLARLLEESDVLFKDQRSNLTWQRFYAQRILDWIQQN